MHARRNSRDIIKTFERLGMISIWYQPIEEESVSARQ
jgi:hypothetical protein